MKNYFHNSSMSTREFSSYLGKKNRESNQFSNIILYLLSVSWLYTTGLWLWDWDWDVYINQKTCTVHSDFKTNDNSQLLLLFLTRDAYFNLSLTMIISVVYYPSPRMPNQGVEKCQQLHNMDPLSALVSYPPILSGTLICKPSERSVLITSIYKIQTQRLSFFDYPAQSSVQKTMVWYQFKKAYSQWSVNRRHKE